MDGEIERPYFKHSIAQLEALFEQSQSDPHVLGMLAYELDFRATDRAAKLRAKVTEVVAFISIKRVNAANAGEAVLPQDSNAPVIAFAINPGAKLLQRVGSRRR